MTVPAPAPAALRSAAAAAAAAAGFLGGWGGGTRMSISGLGLVTPPTSLAVDAPSPENKGVFEIEFRLEFDPVTLCLKSFSLSLT